MNEIIPMNEYVLVELEEKKKDGIYMGDDKDKPKIGKILSFSKECKNKNFEVGKNVVINRYEMIPNGDEANQFFVSEKAIVAMI